MRPGRSWPSGGPLTPSCHGRGRATPRRHAGLVPHPLETLSTLTPPPGRTPESCQPLQRLPLPELAPPHPLRASPSRPFPPPPLSPLRPCPGSLGSQLTLHILPLTSRLRPLGLPLLPGDPPGHSPWTSRSPSAASAPKRSNDASRARSAGHRLGPHSCAMTSSTGRAQTKPPAAGRWGLAIRCEKPLAAHAHWSASRAGADARRGVALALAPKSPEESAFLCLLRPHAGERSSLALWPPVTHSDCPPFRTPPHGKWLCGGWSQWRPPGRRRRRWPGRGRGAPGAGAGRRHLRGRPLSAHLGPPPGAGERPGLRLAPPRLSLPCG